MNILSQYLSLNNLVGVENAFLKIIFFEPVLKKYFLYTCMFLLNIYI